MVAEIRWAPRAASNFEDICNYIAKDSEFYATIFARKINAVIKNIPRFPKAGRIVPEYGDENLREKIYENYRIVYRMKNDIIEVVGIYHGAKSLDNNL